MKQSFFALLCYFWRRSSLADAFAFVVRSGRCLDKVDDARDDDAGKVADAHEVVEGVVHVEAFGNEEFVDGHQDGCHDDSD